MKAQKAHEHVSMQVRELVDLLFVVYIILFTNFFLVYAVYKMFKVLRVFFKFVIVNQICNGVVGS